MGVQGSRTVGPMPETIFTTESGPNDVFDGGRGFAPPPGSHPGIHS